MGSRSRVSSLLDMGRLSQAVSRPGIDPRTWVSLAIVNSVVVDPEEGVFCGITLMPSEIEETARLGAAYAGNGFGFYAPPKVDDEVMVCAPSGDPSQGLVITGRLWSPSDVPPTEASSHPQDVLLKVEDGQTLRLKVSGGGKVIMGDETSAKGVARLDDEVNIGTRTVIVTLLVPSPPSGTITETVADAKGNVISTSTVPYPPAVPPFPPGTYVTQLVGLVSSASETVEAS